MSYEASTVVLNKDGHAVIYTGDNDCFDDAHRLATEAKFDPAYPAFGKDILDKGTLSVAGCDADDLMTWLPLAHGTAGLTAEAGLADPPDVVRKARLAADILGTTPTEIQAVRSQRQ